MVELVYPQSGPVYYAHMDGYLWGPYIPQGLAPEDRIFLNRDDLGYMTEHHGIFGENDVDHQKVEGYIIYQPVLASLYPYQREEQTLEQLRGSLYWGSGISTANFQYGMAISGRCALTGAWYYKGHRRMWRTCLYLDGEWHQYAISLLLKTDASGKQYCDVFNWAHYKYTNLQMSTLQGKPAILYDLYRENISTDTRVDYAWWDSTTHDMLCTFPELVHKVPTPGSPQRLKTAALTYNGAVWSPKQVKDLIATECRKLHFKGFPLELIPFGELTYEAAKKVRACDVNMLEFLRDIRRPWELVPKLRNLRKLKGWADNYLTVEYGILPTIDDLTSIVNALVRRKPYLDKNGYSTYTSYSDQSVVAYGRDYRLVQRAKLAVADENDQLLAFCRRLDDFGFYPRLNDIWDLVPFSFVIDWFVDIGEFLDRIDTRLQIARINIRYATLSYRKSASITLGSPSLPMTGNLSLVHYHRWVTDHCPAPPLNPRNSSDPLSHIIDGGALIIQRHK